MGAPFSLSGLLGSRHSVPHFSKATKPKNLSLRQDDGLRSVAKGIESSLDAGPGTGARRACADFLNTLAAFHDVKAPGIQVLATRPIRTREGGWPTELFGGLRFQDQNDSRMDIDCDSQAGHLLLNISEHSLP
jgi:hypothetical protein